MREKITPFLRRLSHPAIARQYELGAEEVPGAIYSDPLMEDRHEVVKGLVHKYPNRALVKVSYQCAAHCRFCTRIRQIGDPAGTLREAEMEAVVQYIEQHPEIDDVILSGGDPLYTPKQTAYLLQRLAPLAQVKTLRIGTRLPLQSPASFATPLLRELLQQMDDIGRKKPFFLLLHLEHPAELTSETIAVIQQLYQLKVTLLAQTVFLKGINDDFETLLSLFRQLYHLGVQPYYLYHCDRVQGLERFEGDLEKEKQLAKRLRASLSGIACPLFVEDVENGYGKIPVC